MFSHNSPVENQETSAKNEFIYHYHHRPVLLGDCHLVGQRISLWCRIMPGWNCRCRRTTQGWVERFGIWWLDSEIGLYDTHPWIPSQLFGWTRPCSYGFVNVELQGHSCSSRKPERRVYKYCFVREKWRLDSSNCRYLWWCWRCHPHR